MLRTVLRQVTPPIALNLVNALRPRRATGLSLEYAPLSEWPKTELGCAGPGEARRQTVPIESVGLEAATERALANSIVRDNLEILKRVPVGRRFLDYGCGNGIYERVLTHAGVLQPDCEYVGADVNPTMMAWCGRMFARRFVVTDASGRTSFGDGEFDTVFASGVLQLAEDWRGMLDELRRLVSKSGHVVVTRTPVVKYTSTRLFDLTVRHNAETDRHAFRVHNLGELMDEFDRLGLAVRHHEAGTEVLSLGGVDEPVVFRAFAVSPAR